MEIIEVNYSGLNKGKFLDTYHFEDDTIVFSSDEGFEVENLNNIKSDAYYISKVESYTNKGSKSI